MPRDAFDPVRRFIEKRVAAGRVMSVAAGAALGGEVRWLEGFGWADRDREITAAPDVAYPLASISKPMTATGVMALADAGRLNLDASVNSLVDGMNLRSLAGDADAATLRHLASHMGGFAEQFSVVYDGMDVPGMEMLVERHGFLLQPPGERHAYSNLGFGILAHLSAQAAGMPWPAFMRERIFAPLGMEETTADAAEAQRGRCAQTYVPDGAGELIPTTPYVIDTPGAGGVWSSARDLLRFGMMHARGGELSGARILRQETAAAMRVKAADVDGDEDYALGWRVGQRGGKSYFMHDGGMPGVNSQLMIFPEEEAVIVVLANSDSYGVTRSLRDRIAGVLLGEPLGPPRTRTSSKPAALDIGAVAGCWEGTLLHPHQPIRLRLEVGEGPEVRMRLGKRLQQRWQNPELGSGLTGGIECDFLTQPSYHGEVYLRFWLTPRDGRLVGAASALVNNYGVYPYAVSLEPA